jgi:hypothetical protein
MLLDGGQGRARFRRGRLNWLPVEVNDTMWIQCEGKRGFNNRTS